MRETLVEVKVMVSNRSRWGMGRTEERRVWVVRWQDNGTARNVNRWNGK